MELSLFGERLRENLRRETEIIKKLSIPNECSAYVKMVLRKTAYESPEIREIELIVGDQICTPAGLSAHKISDILVNPPLVRYSNEVDGKEEVGIIINGPSNDFIVSSNKLRLEDFFRLYCDKCLTYKFVITGEDEPKEPNDTWFKLVDDYGIAKGYLFIHLKLKEQLYNKYNYILVILFLFCYAFLSVYINRKLRAGYRKKELITACANNEFIPYYQPIVDSAGQTKGVEALMRWRDRFGQVLPPAAFIYDAINLEVINDMTLKIMALSKREFKAVNHGRVDDFFCSFNLAASQVEDDEFIQSVIAVLSGSCFRPEIEITESQKFNDIAAAKSNVTNLKKSGFKIKLDDVGTGYGGFSYFIDFDIDCIKIDKTFIDIIGQESSKLEVLNSIIDMARTLSLEIIVEGVESAEQVNYFTLEKDIYMQGYYFSKPVSDVKELLLNYKVVANST